MLYMIESFLQNARTYLATITSPQLCLICGSFSDSDSPLCRACAETFFSVDSTVFSDSRCAKCGRPLISAIELCVDCRNLGMLKSIDRIISLFPYDAIGQDALVSWKLRGKRSLSRVFANCLARCMEFDSGIRDMTIVPVPPRPQKMKEKGWDQIQELTRYLSRVKKVRMNDCLGRTSAFQQKKLGRSARFANIKGTFIVKDRSTVPETAIVLDDLMTTGSTLDACAETLKNAGCGKVYGLTLFYD
jgi:ComF family protein